MFCTKCGSELREQDRFCSACGMATARGAAPPREEARLSRPMSEAKIAGVCAGFARYLGVDVTVVRIIWVVLAVCPVPFWLDSVYRGVDRDAERSGDRAGTRARHELAQLLFHFFQPIRTLQNFARLAAVRRSDDAFVLHHVENARRAAVA